MLPRFEKIAQGAALPPIARLTSTVSSVYSTMKDNAVLRDLFRSSMVAHGVKEDAFDYSRLGSSDMGNVSHVVPTIHPYLAICDEGVAGHSIAFRDAAITPRADETTLMAAPSGGGRLRPVHGPAARGRRLARVPRRLMEADTDSAGAQLARYYDLDLATETDDVDFYLALTARGKQESWSSVAAAASLAIPIAQAGNRVVGVDKDAAMLARARTKWAAASGPVGSSLELIEADLLSFRRRPPNSTW